ncbi:hypothetical protein [Falsiruegeria litorea]|uniref:Uncharacterized protein n=1 Tax=Falsiruegeria litorea TaxID=1280831 RepID=A0ABS5WUP9_9RHOB|nr:hypothetical protein [Falsiruegeria litorea]MBT3142867.1 hypothetical protein [Falsiruegeria litorea]MBT8167207.1 hypothetical protein [Falsiruegeria litorea]
MAHGYTDLHPTLMPGKENPRDTVLSLEQLRVSYRVTAYKEDVHWTSYW